MIMAKMRENREEIEISAWISCYCLKCLDESIMVADRARCGDRLGVVDDSVESLWLDRGTGRL